MMKLRRLLRSNYENEQKGKIENRKVTLRYIENEKQAMKRDAKKKSMKCETFAFCCLENLANRAALFLLIHTTSCVRLYIRS